MTHEEFVALEVLKQLPDKLLTRELLKCSRSQDLGRDVYGNLSFFVRSLSWSILILVEFSFLLQISWSHQPTKYQLSQEVDGQTSNVDK